MVNLSGGFGHKQSGSRPAVVLVATRTKIAVVVPITGNTEALRFPHTLSLKATAQNGLEHDSVALLFHIRAVDERRIERVRGHLDTETRTEVDLALRTLLGL